MKRPYRAATTPCVMATRNVSVAAPCPDTKQRVRSVLAHYTSTSQRLLPLGILLNGICMHATAVHWRGHFCTHAVGAAEPESRARILPGAKMGLFRGLFES
jgi:hypothetical protein